MWQPWSCCNLAHIELICGSLSTHTNTVTHIKSMKGDMACFRLCRDWMCSYHIYILKRDFCACVCLCVCGCLGVRHLTALNTLEGKGGNPVRGYPPILPCLFCLSCSVCFLNTTHVGQKDDEKTRPQWPKPAPRKREAERWTEGTEEKRKTIIVGLKEEPERGMLRVAVQWDLCHFPVIHEKQLG